MHFLAHMPRMERYIRKGLQHPSCAQLRIWMDKYLPNFLSQEAA
jgi:aminoglycoside/choline kinase family phosphotransferase